MKKLTKTTGILLVLAILCVGLGSAALISYVSNQMTATVSVSSVGLSVGAVEGLLPDPTVGGYDYVGPIVLSAMDSGGSASTTIEIINTAEPISSADVTIDLSYVDPTGTLDPMNCLVDGSYDPAGILTCKVCGPGLNELCISGQEVEIVGIRVWDNGASQWLFSGATDQASCDTLTGAVPGYWDGSRCFLDFKSQLQVSAVPSNPLTLLELIGTTIPTGSMYAQIYVKTTLDPTNKVQIAPGDYSLNVQII